MSFDIKSLNFNVELSSAGTHISSFPSEDVVGISLLKPDQKARKFRLRVSICKAMAEQAKIQPDGFVMVRISDCSNAIQILYQDKQGEHFKGYALKPSGAYRNKEQLKAERKKNGTLYSATYADLTVNFDNIDSKKSRKFDLTYVDALHVAKHLIVVDAKTLSLYV